MTRIDGVKLYFASFEKTGVPKELKIYPSQRAAEISAARNSKVKNEKLCVWNLLDIALDKSFGISTKDAKLYKDENGKWHSAMEGVFFSLSHTDSVCAVAISSHPCGVDIEKFDKDRFGKALAKKILTDGEYDIYLSQSEENRAFYTARKWTEKESVFKLLGESTFLPSHIDTAKYNIFSDELSFGNAVYSVSVSCEKSFEVSVDKSFLKC